MLAVVYLLIPTSNHNLDPLQPFITLLYIFWFLHQTTTSEWYPLGGAWLYIFWFLHQTTTIISVKRVFNCCISFDSYIKPQLRFIFLIWFHVVYLLIPTSNHNHYSIDNNITKLYIFWFLHQTTTIIIRSTAAFGCISFDSYIKPQLKLRNQI